MSLRKLFALFISLFSFQAFSQTTGTEDQVKAVTIPGTQQLKIQSTIVSNQEYVLHVNLPSDYYSNSSKRYPVIYLLDSQWDFPLLSAIYGQQYYDKLIPEAVIIGITWGGTNPDYDKLRARDLTPTPGGSAGDYGNAAKFLAFIKNELSPFIESRFRIKENDRGLVGSSLGGLFTLYALFNETDFFRRYFLTSPAVQWDNNYIFRLESDFYKKRKQLPVRLYMAVGGFENVSLFREWEGVLKKRNYEGLKLNTKVLEGIGHSGSKAEGYTRGIQWVFDKEQAN